MEIKIGITEFLSVLENIKNDFNNNPLHLKSNTPKHKKDLIINSNDEKNIFNIDFENFELLKLENKQNAFGQLNQGDENIYLSRHNISKFEILDQYNRYITVFEEFCICISHKINERMKLLQKNYTENDDKIDINTLKFKDKSDFFIFIQNYCNSFEKSFSSVYFLKLLKQLWICLKIHCDNNINIEAFRKDFTERIKLSCYHIGKRNFYEEDFELHKAVYENNLRMIRKICAMESNTHLFCDINEVDPMGNTPLMLAIKLNNYDAMNVLCDHDADIKHKCFDDDISPFEYAIATRNKKVLKILLNSVKKQKLTHWENSKNDVLKAIKTIPDFSIDLKLNFNSNIFSLFTSITPSDTFKISKLGGNMRIDMNINSSNSSFKSIKGKCSILIQEKGNNVNVYKIDHQKKQVKNLLINFLVM